jgi:protein TonB
MPVLKPLQAAALPGPSGMAGTATEGTGETGKGDGEGEGVGAGRGDVSIVRARWYRKPSPRELDLHVPWKLRQQPIKAVVYLNCRVSLNKRVHNCKVAKEVPVGSGFGAAALAATRSFRVWPVTVNGEPVDDAGVIVPVAYSYN